MEKFTERRIYKRLDMPLPVRYILSDGISGKIIANDISITGISLLLPQKLDIGAKLILTILMPERNRETVIYGEVAWQQKSKELTKEGYITGISFCKADPLDIEEIIASVRSGQYFAVSRKPPSP